MSLNKIGAAVLRRLDPETAHRIALRALQAGFGPRSGPLTSPRLRCTLAGLDLPNPLGLAAGFDKNAVALAPLARAGFGWLEVGAATPLPQPGNPRPRLFRLTEDQAAINRFGFNNEGMGKICQRLAHRPDRVIGLNLGANKQSTDRAADFATVLRHCAEHVDFVTVNVSSPNTEKLRDLQGPEALRAILAQTAEANAMQTRQVPVFLKIAPDLTLGELESIVRVSEDSEVAAIIATNTTIGRSGLKSANSGEKGGLSGQPLFEISTRILAQLSGMTQLPLVGVGGIASADQAYAKIRAGATALQLYTGLVYGGLDLIPSILNELDAYLIRDGYQTLAEAVGTDRARYL